MAADRRMSNIVASSRADVADDPARGFYTGPGGTPYLASAPGGASQASAMRG